MAFEEILGQPLSLLTYGTLLLAIAALWLDRKRVIWAAVFGVALVFGLVSARIQAIALLPVAALAACFYVAERDRYARALRVGLGSAGVFLAVAFAAHSVPGFDNWKILDTFALSENSRPFSLYLNFDKPLVGLFLLAFGAPLLTGGTAWKTMLLGMLPVLLAAMLGVYGLAYLLGQVAFDPKLNHVFLPWALKNLFFTSVAEEALFRGFLQRYLERALDRFDWGKIFSLTAISVLFGLAHSGGGTVYVVLAATAGLFYGYAFQKTGRIEAAILTHFLLNAGHFVFFTYPTVL